MMFHIHIDAEFVDDGIRDTIQSRHGFFDHPFKNPRTDESPYAPEFHLSYETTDVKAFKATFNNIVNLVADSDFVGYVEGEVITKEMTIVKSQKAKHVGSIRTLLNNLSHDDRKAAEIHIAFEDWDQAENLEPKLREIGYQPCTSNKKGREKRIFTAQGKIAPISVLSDWTIDFLQQSLSNTSSCTLQEERIALWWSNCHSFQSFPQIENVEVRN